MRPTFKDAGAWPAAAPGKGTGKAACALGDTAAPAAKLNEVALCDHACNHEDSEDPAADVARIDARLRSLQRDLDPLMEVQRRSPWLSELSWEDPDNVQVPAQAVF
jgi:hypothetical protein